MLQVVHKRKLASKSITEKYKILKEVDKENSCASVAKKTTTQSSRFQTGLKRRNQTHLEDGPTKTLTELVTSD